MNTDSLSINSFLSITENKVDYKSILNKIKDDNLMEFLQLKDNINIVNDFLQKNEKYDILVFLDSDAWIQNGYWLNDIINNLINDKQKQDCFSRDPYVKKNTFINSGSFIVKINDFIN